MKWAAAPALLALGLGCVSAGCGDPNAFDDNVAKRATEFAPVQLDSEQVSLNYAQLACGANSDLWDAPEVGSLRSVSHLQKKGRDLNFSDDITSEEAGYLSPYTQVRGKFPLALDHVVSIKEGEDKDTRIVQAKVGIRVANPCFDTPLFMMGVRKGNYYDDLPITLRYERESDGWHLIKILH